jgi:hypothetical protein
MDQPNGRMKRRNPIKRTVNRPPPTSVFHLKSTSKLNGGCFSFFPSGTGRKLPLSGKDQDYTCRCDRTETDKKETDIGVEFFFSNLLL